MKIKQITLIAVVLLLMFLAYAYGRHLEYKNALKIEANLQDTTAKLNKYLLELLREANTHKAIQVLEGNLEVNKTMSELNDVESRELSYFVSLKRSVSP